MNLVSKIVPAVLIQNVLSALASLLLVANAFGASPLQIASQTFTALGASMPSQVTRLAGLLTDSKWWVAAIPLAMTVVALAALASRLANTNGAFFAVAATGATPVVLWLAVISCQALPPRAAITLLTIFFAVSGIYLRGKNRAIVAVTLLFIAPLVAFVAAFRYGEIPVELDDPDGRILSRRPIGSDPMGRVREASMRPLFRETRTDTDR
ncbi:hypothetical protein [Tsukamurella strandjordii]|uniref:Uncharacterized protein n=1 Tax=Tsukamurella strandjordii TaxID=147577 RepID=A0AA90NDG0_9ACTN|nr:hypothetical protein [Tsukamurella strandjordii]MDP0398397.1 hypothetical protein [Tsukamurella strandjordii]